MEGWLKDPAADSAGSVAAVSVGGVRAKGTQVRAAWSLAFSSSAVNSTRL